MGVVFGGVRLELAEGEGGGDGSDGKDEDDDHRGDDSSAWLRPEINSKAHVKAITIRSGKTTQDPIMDEAVQNGSDEEKVGHQVANFGEKEVPNTNKIT
ncbi:hypothetical protein L1987_78492 [Smallanthus sonchifolius]|uniref:Uncharacterized protein n=1 Tax=Smallanthus sonchifolius TaxID=185202 RepID=A0ACB8ZCT8_9ASTR|nr:hypothetical protein L1987_78492 [Smallanthus sonchifolius]